MESSRNKAWAQKTDSSLLLLKEVVAICEKKDFSEKQSLVTALEQVKSSVVSLESRGEDDQDTSTHNGHASEVPAKVADPPQPNCACRLLHSLLLSEPTFFTKNPICCFAELPMHDRRGLKISFLHGRSGTH